MSDDRDNDAQPSRLAVVWEYIWTLGLMALVVFSARSSLADWYEVPSGSMLPTILEGDRIFVNKLAYNLRVPFTTFALADLGDLRRGDIMVFIYPGDGRTDYVKRLVGLPGDTIEVRDDVLYINGEPQVRRPARPDELPAGAELEPGKQLFVEDLMGERHLVYEAVGARTDYGPHLVSAGHVFAMGDNRDNSSDSRTWGEVPISFVKGRALRVVLHIEQRGPCQGLSPACRLGFFSPYRVKFKRSFLSLYGDFPGGNDIPDTPP